MLRRLGWTTLIALAALVMIRTPHHAAPNPAPDARTAQRPVADLEDVALPHDQPAIAMAQLDAQTTLIAVTTEQHGREPWIVDTASGHAQLLADLCPGSCSSLVVADARGGNPAAGGLAYFAADDGARGRALWRTDGTAAGTWPVLDECPGPCGTRPWIDRPGRAAALADRLVLLPEASGTNGEIWITDGTSAGTRPFTGLDADGSLRAPRHLVTLDDDRVLVSARAVVDDAGTLRDEIWLIDAQGTAQRTALPDGRLGRPAGSTGERFDAPPVIVDGTVYAIFAPRRTDGSLGSTELWRIEPAGGAAPITDLCGGGCDSQLSGLTAIDDRLYFYFDPSNGADPRVMTSDGTAHGTFDIVLHPKFQSRSAGPFVALGREPAPGGAPRAMAFRGPGNDGFEALWTYTPGQFAATRLLDGDRDISEMASSADGLLFLRPPVEPLFEGIELWQSDGTPAGTQRLRILPATFPEPAISDLWTAADGSVLLAMRPTGGPNIGAQRVLTRIADGAIDPLQAETRIQLASSNPRRFVALNRGALFVADQFRQQVRPDNPYEDMRGTGLFYALDGTVTDLSTALGADVQPRDLVSPLTQLSGRDVAVFAGRVAGPGQPAPVTGDILWRTDGTEAGTAPLAAADGSTPIDISGPLRSHVRTERGDAVLWLQRLLDVRPAPWRTDGDRLTPLPLPVSADASEIASFNGALYLLEPGALDAVLLRSPSDDQPFDTAAVLVRDLINFNARPSVLRATSRHLYALGELALSPITIVAATGPDRAVRPLDLTPVLGSAAARAQLAYGTRRASDDPAMRWLVAVDGDGLLAVLDVDGTHRLIRVVGDQITDLGAIRRGDDPAWALAPPTPTASGIFLPVLDDDHGAELWIADRRANSLRPLIEIMPGARGGSPRHLRDVDGQLVFTATDDRHGAELWTSDGTAAGTRRLTDVAPGPAASDPGPVTVAGNQLYYAANNGVSGREAWRTPTARLRPAGACVASDRVLCLLDGRFRVTARWRDQRTGNEGVAGTDPRGDRSGLLWFFRPDNVELIVKMLDGTDGPSQAHWFFYGALSDVEYTITVQDTDTGRVRTYVNPAGEICGRADTGAFPRIDSLTPGAPAINQATTIRPARPNAMNLPFAPGGANAVRLPFAPATAAATGANACVPDAQTLCLLDGRLAVDVSWRDPRTGDEGVGRPVTLPGRSGLFWFFRPDNVELAVKALDGTDNNGHLWLFYGALTDLEYTITVRDGVTGRQVQYRNPPFEICGRGDTTALPTADLP
ncbi:MAG: hypothetical protein AAF772_09005 [Acidobacteriota bacterium]